MIESFPEKFPHANELGSEIVAVFAFLFLDFFFLVVVERCGPALTSGPVRRRQMTLSKMKK